MSQISINNLSFGYDNTAENVFENMSLNLDTAWKTGLIGRNGRGKTTLFKLLLGELEYSGSISADVDFYCFPFKTHDKSVFAADIIGEICGREYWEIVRELNFLSLDESVLYRPFETLSPGEQTKCLLCALFLIDGAFLLLDEPTNHLDSEARNSVVSYLKGKSGFIIVSHNRFLLNEVCDHIVSINKSSIDVTAGNFDVWQNGFENRRLFEQRRNDKINKDIKRLQSASRQTQEWSVFAEKGKFGRTNSGSKLDRGYIGHKAAKMMARSKNIEKRLDREIRRKQGLLSDSENDPLLKFNSSNYRSHFMGFVKNLSLCFDGDPIFGNVSFEVCRGDRIALEGKNGSGKTSLIKIITGEISEYGGEADFANDLKISYVPQSVENMSGSLADYAEKHGVAYGLLLTVLSKLGFQQSLYDKSVQSYSDGQKKKVQLAASLCSEADLYIWDEPLNYIDIISRMQLEKLIDAFEPTMIFVEHDEMFCKNTATKTVRI